MRMRLEHTRIERKLGKSTSDVAANMRGMNCLHKAGIGNDSVVVC